MSDEEPQPGFCKLRAKEATFNLHELLLAYTPREAHAAMCALIARYCYDQPLSDMALSDTLVSIRRFYELFDDKDV